MANEEIRKKCHSDSIGLDEKNDDLERRCEL